MALPRRQHAAAAARAAQRARRARALLRRRRGAGRHLRAVLHALEPVPRAAGRRRCRRRGVPQRQPRAVRGAGAAAGGAAGMNKMISNQKKRMGGGGGL